MAKVEIDMSHVFTRDAWAVSTHYYIFLSYEYQITEKERGANRNKHDKVNEIVFKRAKQCEKNCQHHLKSSEGGYTLVEWKKQ